MADAVSAFKVLLSEVVRDVVEPTNASWRAVLPRLRKDPQVRKGLVREGGWPVLRVVQAAQAHNQIIAFNAPC
jgi:hypothetical protein